MLSRSWRFNSLRVIRAGLQTSDREGKHPTASPLPASSQQLAGSPRTLIITAENDVLRDEGEAYNRKLIGAGVEVVTTRYNATTHDFVMLTSLTKLNPRTRRKVASRLAPAASIQDARVDGKYNRLRENLLSCF